MDRDKIALDNRQRLPRVSNKSVVQADSRVLEDRCRTGKCPWNWIRHWENEISGMIVMEQAWKFGPESHFKMIRLNE
jgi:hypothetical protein